MRKSSSMGTGRAFRRACGGVRPTTLVVLTSLVAGLITLGPPSAVAAAPKAARDLPALPSPPAPRSLPEEPAGSSDLASIPPTRADQVKPRPPQDFDPAKATPLDAETTPTKRVY